MTAPAQTPPGRDTPATARCRCGHTVAEHVVITDMGRGRRPEIERGRGPCSLCACGGPR